MSFFADVKQADTLEETKDYVGGSYAPLPSGVYDASIKYAYTGESRNGAKSITFAFDIDGRELTETFYVTNRNKQTYYTKDGKNYPLPAYTTVNDISRLALKGKQITELTTSKKVLELYDWESRGKKKTAVDVFTDLIGQSITLGIKQVKDFKQVKDASGNYVNGTDIREYNSIDKAFHPSHKKTVNELLAKKDTASFIDEWRNKWDNTTDDKTGGAVSNNQTQTTTQTQTADIDDDVFGD